jgi:twitching motility protein PilT
MAKSINELLHVMVKAQASDLHLKLGSPAIMRVNRELVPCSDQALSPDDIQIYLKELMRETQMRKFEENYELDFAYTVSGLGRFRTNVFYQRGSVGIVLRFVKNEIPDFDSLSLPDYLSRFCQQERGLILVAGATNSGKSTTLAAIVGYINKYYKKHIVTIEDPIEFLHQDRSSIVNQREVGIDTHSFPDALKHILRQDPDVILIGEMRDAESFTAGLQAAETGHLVLSTVHAGSAANTVDRILDFFEDSDMRDQARFQLANNLVAIIAQRLLPLKKGHGLIPAIEIMTGTPLIRKMIHENNLKKLPQVISSGQDSEMISFNQSILKLIQSGSISKEVGLSHATNAEALRMNLQGIFLDEGRKIVS